MKKIITFLFVLILMQRYNLCAQENGAFEISENGSKISLNGNDITKAYNSIEIKFDDSFRNKLIEIWSKDKSQVATLNGKKFGKGTNDIQGSTNGFLVTIQNNHKVKQCPDCVQDVPEDFTIKLDDTFYGPFHLTSKENPVIVSTIDTTPLKNKPYSPGYVLYDAIYISKNLNNSTANNTIRLILKEYNINNENLNDNSFLNGTLKQIYLANISKTEGVQALSKANLSSLIGGLDVTNIADGFSKFIVKRTKQELSTAFFDQFKEDLDKFSDIKSVFPQTYRALSSIGEEIYKYEAYIQTLRESFEKDLASLPSNLPTIIDNHKDYFDHNPNLRAILKSAFFIAQSIQDKQHPGTMLENFPIDDFEDVTNQNIKPSFQTLILLSTSLKSNVDGDSYWAPYTDIKSLFTNNDEIFLKIYLGLLEQKAKSENIVFKDSTGKVDYPLYKIIDGSFRVDLPNYLSYIKNVALKIQSLEMKIKSLKKISSDSLLLENYYSVISSSFDLMKSLTQIENLPDFPKDLHLQDLTRKYFEFGQTATDIVIDVNRRNYSSAIVNAINLYDSSIIENGVSKDVIQKILKYGSFMAEIVQAKNSDEVESAIEAVALPSGSARIKRESCFNISLNAYCGVFVGQNRTKLWSKPQYTYGLTAPIGVAVSWGVDHSSFSAFASIIDLGAVTAFRFSNDTASIAKIALKDIISPGLFVSYGIPRCPISINIGCQLAPFLTSVSSKGNNSTETRMLRFTAGLCVDIPIFNLHTSSKK